MRILGIETSGRTGGFAVVENGHPAAELICDMMGRHLEKGMAMIEEVLERASARIDDLDGVAVSLGPGSFTGLRVGLAIAKGICFGRRIPLVGVPTLDCIAESLCCWEGVIVPMRDARRGEIYFCIYQAEECSVRRSGEYLALTPQPVADEIERISGGQRILLTGDALAKYGEILRSKLGSKVFLAPEAMWMPRPAVVGLMGLRQLIEGKAVDLDSTEPMYLRRSEAERKAGGLVHDGTPRNKKNERR